MDARHGHQSFSSSSNLTSEMKKRSRKAHSFSDALVNSRLVLLYSDPKLYGRALSLFLHLFSALEEALESSSHALGEKRMILLQRLYRSRHFQSDVEFYLGAEGWREEAERVRAENHDLQLYAEHLHHLTKSSHPFLLLAHAYTQFMAVLSGGQILKGLAKRNLKLQNSKDLKPSTQSFEYPTEQSVSSLKAEFRSMIDNLGMELTEDQREAFLAEHLFAFRSNNKVMRAFKMGYKAMFLNQLTIKAFLIGAFVAGLATVALYRVWPGLI